MSSAQRLLDTAGRHRSPATLPEFHAAGRRGTRVNGTRLTRPRSMRSSPSCATLATSGMAIASMG